MELYEQGLCAKGSAYTDLLYLIPTYGVQAIFDSLPRKWHEDFRWWLVRNYDNDCPPEDFAAYGLTEEEEKIKGDPILLVRAWLRGNASSKK
ncbi:MAG: hypothetical protein R3B48_27885 [Kofleriaceae bacterium]